MYAYFIFVAKVFFAMIFGAAGWSLVVFIVTGEEATDLGAVIAGMIAVAIALWLLFKKRS